MGQRVGPALVRPVCIAVRQLPSLASSSDVIAIGGLAIWDYLADTGRASRGGGQVDPPRKKKGGGSTWPTRVK